MVLLVHLHPAQAMAAVLETAVRVEASMMVTARALVEAKMVAVVTVHLPWAATSVRQQSSIVLNPSIPKKPGGRDIKAPSCNEGWYACGFHVEYRGKVQLAVMGRKNL